MCYFAHFGLMINLIFLQNVPFFMQDIGVIYQIFAKFHGFIVKYRFQNNFFQKKFFKKKAGNSNFLRLKIGDFWMGLTGHGQARTHFWKKFWEAQIPNFLALWAPRPVFARFWPFLRPQIWWFLAFLRHFWPLKMVVSSHTGNES